MDERSELDACMIGKLCQRDVICIGGDQSIVAAAECMRAHHIGCLVVTQTEPGAVVRRAIGILTDRDIVVSVVARRADPAALKVCDVMSRNPLMVRDDTSLDAALSFMQDAGVRRVVVTGRSDEVIGMLSIDDVLQKISLQLGMVCGSLRNEIRTERLVRP